ncbi:helix-turn-helix transcriptional regulator [Leucobacter coleopterorum]|uniref:Helix-turn-helix transcriptional regulator n=1 Tax=Leucobacter coleopterorum TaxID=2714933 RepID=A0ABX6JXC0_9MICO|nr:metalloregulator ArsR/SmtB family transcription factor [Leucobacter coleopterorum]QIM18956.1 helix-turn-helix transcriptional regulator [Leucobacter coleopterorum]
MCTLQALDTTEVRASYCAAPTYQVIGDDEAQRLSKVFKALGDPTRVRLLSLISVSANTEMCVCDLTAPVGLSQPTVSHHMKQLVEAGLVTREQRGRWAYYSPATSVLTAATETLTNSTR